MATSIGTTVADITAGGGAAQVTIDVINAVWKNAQSKSEAGAENIDEAIAMADPAPHLTGPTLDKSYVPATSPTLPNDDPNNAEALYNTQRDQMLAMITSNFRSFIDEYFPDPEFYENALDWCGRAISEGGTGINTGVESALWQRGRARILGDSERAAAEAEQNWANRRFPLPPGALVNQLNQINLDAGRKLAEVSRDVAVKSFETEIENVRFAVKEVIDQRKVALDAAGEYIKTLMLGPQTAMQLATGLANIRSELARNLVALYTAQNAALEPRVRLAITDAQLKLEASKANLQAQSSTTELKVRAAIAGAQMVAAMASAAINAIGARASISGSDTSTV